MTTYFYRTTDGGVGKVETALQFTPPPDAVLISEVEYEAEMALISAQVAMNPVPAGVATAVPSISTLTWKDR